MDYFTTKQIRDNCEAYASYLPHEVMKVGDFCQLVFIFFIIPDEECLYIMIFSIGLFSYTIYET